MKESDYTFKDVVGTFYWAIKTDYLEFNGTKMTSNLPSNFQIFDLYSDSGHRYNLCHVGGDRFKRLHSHSQQTTWVFKIPIFNFLEQNAP